MAGASNFRQPMPGVNGPGYQNVSYGVPPPLPPRNYPGAMGYNASSMFPTRFGGYSGYGTGYGGYGGYGGMGGYGGYGGYSGYGGYGQGYGGPTEDGHFLQAAEGAARPVFDSFQSIMGMIHSISYMFDSTFQAVHGSYASVLGVSQNFSRMSSMVAGLVYSFPALKGLIWLFRRILYVLGLRQNDPTLENIWSEAASQIEGAAGPAKSNWPALALFAMLLAGPYVIMKLIMKMVPTTQTSNWNPSEHTGSRANALYNFVPASQAELGIQRGQVIMVAPKQFQPNTPGWVLACDQSRKVGLVPANYIVEGIAQQPIPRPAPQPQPSTSWADESLTRAADKPETPSSSESTSN